MTRFPFLAFCVFCCGGSAGAQTTIPIGVRSAIGRPGITIGIPPAATHLFVTPADIYYCDHSDPDGDLGVKITLISTTSAREASLEVPRLTISTRPNPFTTEASIAFRLGPGGPGDSGRVGPVRS